MRSIQLVGVRRTWVFLSLAGLAFLGCGGDSDGSGTPSRCGTVQACGGDVVGTWDLLDPCLTPAVLKADLRKKIGAYCVADGGPTETVTVKSLEFSGTQTYRADLTYALEQTTRLTVTMELPASCLNGLTCGLLPAAIPSGLGRGIDSATCSGSTTCNCTIVETPQLISESGTYTLRDTELSTEPTSGDSKHQTYCVQGYELHLTGSTATGTVAIETVAKRR